MAASEDDNGALVKVNLRVGLEFKEIHTSIPFITTYLTKIIRAVLAAETWALVAAVKNFAAPLIARNSVAGCSARHCTGTFVFARPCAFLDARGTGFAAN
jgi:hypothetical protein